jgi:signal peptide peptidase SppA
MRYDRLFTKLYTEPLVLKAAAWRGFERALLNHASAFASNGEKKNHQLGILSPTSKKERLDNILEIRGDTALLYIDGAIDKHISAFEMECYGGFDLRDLDNALAQVAADPAIANVMLCFNSPGGSVTGVPETAAKVTALAKRKNVFAFTDGMCCSAAYWIASQAHQIFGTASSDVGSIGVYCAVLDATAALEMEGLKVNFIKDGTYKGMGAPFKPLTDDERDMFQAEVDKIGGMFRGAILSQRPKVDEETMQGQSFFGDDALAAGLVDAIVPDLAAALAQF